MADQAAPTALKDIVRDASMLAEKRKELDTLRGDHAREWALNREFYRGNQWVFWNRNAGRVESLGTDEADKPRYKVRLTIDQIKPATQQLVAMMTKTRPVMRAVPSGSSDKDVKAAQMGEDLYKHWWSLFGLTGKLQSALTQAQISQGYWLITWDPLAGTPLDVMLNPNDGKPITDDRLADLMKDEIEAAAQQHGVDPEQVLAQVEKRLYLGDIKVQVLSGEQVWLLGTGTNFEDMTGAICRYAMDVDEIRARWGNNVTADASTTENGPVLAGTKGKDDQLPKNARNVYVGYFKPSPSLPKGRYVVWIESPNEILYQSDWELPTHDLPLVKFPGIENDRSVYDFTRIAMARPIQKELNNTISKIAMYKNLTLKPQVMAPIGSLRQRLTDEPGAVIEYSPVGGLAPEWRPAPSPPPYVFEYLQQIQSRLDRVFNLMPTERSQLPARADSGEMVDLIQEAVADQITPEIRRMEEGLARAGDLMDALAQEYYIEPRMLAITGEGGSVRVKEFMRSNGKYTFHAEAGSGLPRTRAGQMKQLREMIEMQVISPSDALPYMPIAGLKTIQARLAADEDQALRETDKLISGQPTNPNAYMQAVQAVQTGQPNPQTGQPFQNMQEAQAFVMQEALSPLPYEDLQTHLAMHSLYMKSVEFEALGPDVQQRFVQHFMLTRQTLMSMPHADKNDMRVTLGLNGTVGPTVASEILRNKGIIGATPEAMAEPPLETSVYDSTDKPNVEAEGNHPLDDLARQHAMQQQEEQHGLTAAKATAEAALAEKRVSQAEHQHAHDTDAQTMSQSERLQKMRHAEEIHQEKLKQMRKPKAASTGDKKHSG
jgi:hypothetical protein